MWALKIFKTNRGKCGQCPVLELLCLRAVCHVVSLNGPSCIGVEPVFASHMTVMLLLYPVQKPGIELGLSINVWLQLLVDRCETE
jgi:cytochrome c oxidase assembly factor CtaG